MLSIVRTSRRRPRRLHSELTRGVRVLILLAILRSVGIVGPHTAMFCWLSFVCVFPLCLGASHATLIVVWIQAYAYADICCVSISLSCFMAQDEAFLKAFLLQAIITYAMLECHECHVYMYAYACLYQVFILLWRLFMRVCMLRVHLWRMCDLVYVCARDAWYVQAVWMHTAWSLSEINAFSVSLIILHHL